MRGRCRRHPPAQASRISRAMTDSMLDPSGRLRWRRGTLDEHRAPRRFALTAAVGRAQGPFRSAVTRLVRRRRMAPAGALHHDARGVGAVPGADDETGGGRFHHHVLAPAGSVAGTAANEFRDEFTRRVDLRQRPLHGSQQRAAPGVESDRGRIYVTFGPPEKIEPYPSGAHEIWRYSDREQKFAFAFSVPPITSCDSSYRILSPAADCDGARSVHVDSGLPAPVRHRVDRGRLLSGGQRGPLAGNVGTASRVVPRRS
jgi:GWxTD domain-containing protein